MSETFGQYLRRLRERAGLSQPELAEKCGWGRRSGQVQISRYETDVETPTIASAVTLMTALGGSLDELYGL